MVTLAYRYCVYHHAGRGRMNSLIAYAMNVDYVKIDVRASAEREVPKIQICRS